MNRGLSRAVVSVAATVLGLTSTSASAQVLGTFRWQFAPYCNVVTVRIEQKGPTIFELLGTDDGCDGAAPAATANGSAHLNAGGSVTLSLALVRGDGFVVNNNILLNPLTLAGNWKDDWGNSGTFVSNPPAPVAGDPRRLTMRGDYSVDAPATGANSEVTASYAFPRPLPAAPVAVAANVIPVGGPATVNCPGSSTNPEAAAGHLCLYETLRTNVDLVIIFSAADLELNQATTTGFSVVTNATAAGNTRAIGRWAVTVP